MQAVRPLLTLMVLLAGCVSPLVNFTPYSMPNFPKDEFEHVFTAWKAGRAQTWEIHYRGSAFSEDELVLTSSGTGSLGARLPTGDQKAKSFTPTKAELTKMVDKLLASNIFGLYDGHYAAWTQGGGLGGAEIRVIAGSIEKRVSKDPGLSGSISLEAASIQTASDAILEIAYRYLR